MAEMPPPFPEATMGWEVVPQAVSMGTAERAPVPQAVLLATAAWAPVPQVVVLLEGCAVRATLEKAMVCVEEVAAMG